MYTVVILSLCFIQVFSIPLNSTKIFNETPLEKCKLESEDLLFSQIKKQFCNEVKMQLKHLPCENPILLSFCGPLPLNPCSLSNTRFSRNTPSEQLLEKINNLLPVKPNLLDPLGLTRKSKYDPIEGRQKQKRILEGLLRLVTIINDLDEFVTHKGRHIIAALNRMLNE